MKILGIETSCDDTAVALLQEENGSFRVIKELRSSQIELHKEYGGIVPEVAARAHSDIIMPLVETILDGQKPDLIAATSGPGLITALLVGAQTGTALSYALAVPLVAINHIEGHIYANWLQDPNIELPALCLIVSGGHTELVLMREHGKYELLGRTRDDAAGEAYDKVGKLVGFEYPGGPKIAHAAEKGNPDAIEFPRPMIDSKNYEFSFAGLKTAALYAWRNSKDKSEDYQNSFCSSFQKAVTDVLVKKTVRAAKEFRPKSVLLGGGVAANANLRSSLESAIATRYPEGRLILPPLSATVDNAAMIAVAGFFHAQRGDTTSWKDVAVDPEWRIESL